jgi:hypothetical protein
MPDPTEQAAREVARALEAANLRPQASELPALIETYITMRAAMSTIATLPNITNEPPDLDPSAQ